MRMKIRLKIIWADSFFILVSCILLCYLSVHPASSQCPDDQKSLLLELRNSLEFNHSYFTNLVSWNENTDCCEWGGVTCSNGNVVELDLSDEGIIGAIHNSNTLFRMQSLQRLNLANNYGINGTIPSALGRLSNLTYLNLFHTGFTGQVPIQISYLVNLLFLGISQIRLLQLRRCSPFMRCQRRDDSLHVSTNNDHKLYLKRPNLATIIQNLTYLTDLRLGGIDLSGNEGLPIDSRAATNSPFPQLVYLSLSSCNLSVLPEFLRTQAHLEQLDLSNNHIQGTLPSWIWNISQTLQFLNLSHNNLVDLELPIPNAPSDLLSLDLHSNELQGELPSQILGHETLRYVDCSNNNFTSIDPNIGNNLTSVAFLSLARNHIHGNIPTSLCNANTSLQVLELEDNHFNGSIPHCLIATTPILAVLNAEGNNLTGVIPNKFGKACKLETLKLNGNFLQGQIPRSLANCRELKVLDVGNNQFNGGFPCKLKSLSKLQVLILRSNKFSGSFGCPDKENNSIWPSLQILDLAFNQFNGELKAQHILNWTSMMAGVNVSESEQDPLQYKSDGIAGYYQDTVVVSFKGIEYELQKILRIFTSIDLSNNCFGGKIPQELGNLNGLIVLNLSHNSLLGNIPSSFGNLRQLESLDLSCNTLSGNIPQGLANLNFLEYLNLSSNKLTGAIPKSTQLQSFYASSYQGNQGLYGPPLTPFSGNTAPNPGMTPPTFPEESDWSWKNQMEWMLRGAEVGFPVGLIIFFGPLLYIESLRQWYCNLLERLVLKMLRREDKARGTQRRTRPIKRQPQQPQRH